MVPDEFNVGYQSFQEVAEKLGHSLRKMEDRETDYTVIRRDTLFTKENPGDSLYNEPVGRGKEWKREKF